MSRTLRGSLLLLLTSVIWGSAFVAQSVGSGCVGPFTFCFSRNALAFLALIPVILIFGKRPAEPDGKKRNPFSADAITLKGGICCGAVLFFAGGTQQIGIGMTTAGKAGFITALYIILVPIFGTLLGKKPRRIIWLCALIGVAGFWLLCVKEGFSVSPGDLIVLVCAFGYTAHVLTIDHFMELGADGVRMSWIQFLTAGVLSAVCMLLTEKPEMSAVLSAWTSIAYAGVMSSGVGYTLQILGQRDTEVTTATLIMSLESVFAALAGWVILHEVLSPKELAGCMLVFAAVILAQVPLPVRKRS